MKGLRYNEGKTRYDLVPPFAQEQYALVLTKGAEKYAERNWELGMKWSKVIASLERHIAAIKRGEDYDPETGLLHSAHVMCNAGFLTEYYKIFPQGDDRPHGYLNPPKIGLDIDGVLAFFAKGFYDYFKVDYNGGTYFWHDGFINENFHKIANEADFWLNLEPMISPSQLNFEPSCYITSRPIDSEVSREWLVKHGFSDVPVHTVGVDQSKVEVAIRAGIDIFIDDRYRNFVELTRGGIFTYLLSRPYNRKYEVGFRRLDSLMDLNFNR